MRHQYAFGTHPLWLSFARGAVRTSQSLRVLGRFALLARSTTDRRATSCKSFEALPLPQLRVLRLCEKRNGLEPNWYCRYVRSVRPVRQGAKAKAYLIACSVVRVGRSVKSDSRSTLVTPDKEFGA